MSAEPGSKKTETPKKVPDCFKCRQQGKWTYMKVEGYAWKKKDLTSTLNQIIGTEQTNQLINGAKDGELGICQRCVADICTTKSTLQQLQVCLQRMSQAKRVARTPENPQPSKKTKRKNVKKRLEFCSKPKSKTASLTTSTTSETTTSMSTTTTTPTSATASMSATTSMSTETPATMSTLSGTSSTLATSTISEFGVQHNPVYENCHSLQFSSIQQKVLTSFILQGSVLNFVYLLCKVPNVKNVVQRVLLEELHCQCTTLASLKTPSVLRGATVESLKDGQLPVRCIEEMKQRYNFLKSQMILIVKMINPSYGNLI